MPKKHPEHGTIHTPTCERRAREHEQQIRENIKEKREQAGENAEKYSTPLSLFVMSMCAVDYCFLWAMLTSTLSLVAITGAICAGVITEQFLKYRHEDREVKEWEIAPISWLYVNKVPFRYREELHQ